MTSDKTAGKEWNDEELLEGLIAHNGAALHLLYQRYLPEISRWVVRNNGTITEAGDVFQESLIVLFQKAKEADFKLTTRLGAYLQGVARFVWLRQLRKKSRTVEVTFSDEPTWISEDRIEELLIASEKKALFKEKLQQLKADCQRVLELFFLGTPLKTIAQEMGYTEDYIKKKNRLCKQKLSTLVREDARYQELKATD